MAFRTLDDIATEAYVYLYPLVVMEATKQKMRAGSSSGDTSANLLSHQMKTATDKWRAVARPNIDTLFSAAWVDLSAGPAVLTLPPAGDRYHMFQLLDFWTDTFAVPGSRSNGQDGVRVRIVGPQWESASDDDGDDVDHIVKCPTPTMWVLGRTAIGSGPDIEAAREFVRGCTLVPLESAGFADEPDVIDPDLVRLPPVAWVESLSPAGFFEIADRVLRRERAHGSDGSIVMRLAALGIGGRSPFVFDRQTAEVRNALAAGASEGQPTVAQATGLQSRHVNGWTYSTSDVGTWGNNYLRRAYVARIGIAANPTEDAVYINTVHDDHGEKLEGDHEYVIHFDREPPAHAFWSLTAYDREAFLMSNEINRFGIRGRDDFKKNADGSFDIHLGTTCPPSCDPRNWIPTQPGRISLTLRLYMPSGEFLNGSWTPPPISVVSTTVR